MHLNIIKKENTTGRSDFQKWQIYPDKIIIETMAGYSIPVAPQLGEIVELCDGGVIIATITAQSVEVMEPLQLYLLYKQETGKEATYMKGDQEIEYAKYKTWLEKLNKDREF